MSKQRRLVVSCLLALVLVLLVPLSFGCGAGGGKQETFTVGILNDLTGAAAPSTRWCSTTLSDLVQYLSGQDFFHGVKVKLISYDNQFNQSKDIPGYYWLKEKGAKLIIIILPQTGVTLKEYAAREKVLILGYQMPKEVTEPPGWIFDINPSGSSYVKTLLEFVSGQWDYATMGRKPRLGSVSLDYTNDREFRQGAKDYVAAHPDKFDYVASPVAGLSTVTWLAECTATKDCDYVLCPGLLGSAASFIKEYRSRGYKATLIDTDAISQTSFLANYCGWEALDGLLTIHASRFWGETNFLSQLADEVAHRYHANDYQDMVNLGVNYIGAFDQGYIMLDFIRKAIEEVGVENLDGQALYNVAITFSAQYEGFKEVGWSESERVAQKYLSVYRWDAQTENLVLVGDWVPAIK